MASDSSPNETIQGPPELVHTRECWRCAERYTQHGAAGRECPECGYDGSSEAEPEGDRETMCTRHWLLDGVRDGSCPDCLGARLPDGRGAVIATEDCGVTFAGDTGDIPQLAPAVLAPLSEFARTSDVHPGDVIATFPPDDIAALEVVAETDRQVTLREVADV